MTPFELGFINGLQKLAFLRPPRLSYLPEQEQKKPPSWHEAVEEAAKTVFGVKEPEPFGYGVGKTKIGDKQVAPPYVAQDPKLQKKTNDLNKKWSTTGVKPSNVGAGTREMPRISARGQ